MSDSNLQAINQNAKQTITFSKDLEVADISESGAEVLNFDPDNVIGKHASEISFNFGYEEGRRLERVMRGEEVEGSQEVIGGDERLYHVSAEYSMVNCKGDECLHIEFEVENILIEPKDELDRQPILENLRINTPDGPITLKQLMEDLDAGWKEIEDYRDGSLVLYQNLDERLTEELLSNPDGDHVEVLREAKQAVYDFHLHLRDS